jgi:hypothetical protein
MSERKICWNFKVWSVFKPKYHFFFEKGREKAVKRLPVISDWRFWRSRYGE